MLTFFTLFFTLFSFWLLFFVFSSIFNILIIVFGFVVSVIIAITALKYKIYSSRNQFIFLQVGFYKLLVEKIIVSFGENIYLAVQFLRPNGNIDPVVDYLYNENDDIYENNLVCNILNIHFGIVACLVKNQCFFIHSLNSLFFSPNQLYFLNIETQKVNDDSLV